MVACCFGSAGCRRRPVLPDRDDIEERALAAAAGADHGDELAGATLAQGRQSCHPPYVLVTARSSSSGDGFRRGFRRSSDGHVVRLDRSLHRWPLYNDGH